MSICAINTTIMGSSTRSLSASRARPGSIARIASARPRTQGPTLASIRAVPTGARFREDRLARLGRVLCAAQVLDEHRRINDRHLELALADWELRIRVNGRRGAVARLFKAVERGDRDSVTRRSPTPGPTDAAEVEWWLLAARCANTLAVRRGRWARCLGAVVIATVIVMVIVMVSVAAGGSVRAHAALTPQCPAFPYSATRDPSNPLELPSAPGSNPLHGAHLFVDGPRHGAAAGAIAQLLGIDPTTYPDNYSWASFKQDIGPGGSLNGKLVGNPQLAAKVALLSQIADQQETQNLSLYSQGGGPGAIYSQVQKILCHSLTADPNPYTVPVFSTFFIYPSGQFCPALSALLANTETFKRQIGEVAAGTGTHPAVFLLEIDAVGTSTCLTRAELTVWESDLRYEIEQLTALPHAVVYVEGGAADEDSAAYVAKVLNEICVVKTQSAVTNVCAQLRGFWVNGTHFDWTIHEINWANQVVALLRKLTLKETGHSTAPPTRSGAYIAHYVVNTAQNGQGPKLNPHPSQQGIEDLCNPPGRGLGRAPTADTDPTFDGHAFPLTDAFLWTGVPGRSHNSNCHPGDAPAGVFDVRFALELATNASNQLGPSAAVAGVSASATVVRGVVLIKDKTSGRFVPLNGSDVAVPMGATIDARKGTVVLTTAADYRNGLDPLHRVQTGRFSAAMFLIKQLTERQARAHHQTGIPATDLVLTNAAGAVSKARCRRRGPPGKGVVRSLNGVAKGVYRTIGGASTTSVTNATWTVQDRCDGTLTKVRKGRAKVTPKARHGRQVTLSAGQELLVRARLLGAKVS